MSDNKIIQVGLFLPDLVILITHFKYYTFVTAQITNNKNVTTGP